MMGGQEEAPRLQRFRSQRQSQSRSRQRQRHQQSRRRQRPQRRQLRSSSGLTSLLLLPVLLLLPAMAFASIYTSCFASSYTNTVIAGGGAARAAPTGAAATRRLSSRASASRTSTGRASAGRTWRLPPSFLAAPTLLAAPAAPNGATTVGGRRRHQLHPGGGAQMALSGGGTRLDMMGTRIGSGSSIGTMPPTAMSAALTILLAADLLVVAVRRGRSGGSARGRDVRGSIAGAASTGTGRGITSSSRSSRSRSSTSLAAASLEEASLYRPFSPRPSSPPTTKSDNTTTFAAPSLFNPSDSRPIVLFDGQCNLCNWGVQLLLDYDSCTEDERGNLRVAALQSRVGRLLVDRLVGETREEVMTSSSLSSVLDDGDDNDGGDIDDDDDGEDGDDNDSEEEERYKSIVVCGPTQTWTQTSAILKMGRSMTSYPIPFRPLALLAYLIPSPIRNFMYKYLSRYRKKLFGERAECRLWDDNFEERFVDDSILGGVGSTASADDPFADPNAPRVAATAADDSPREIEQVNVGDTVRIVSPTPVVVKHLSQYPNGLCVSGCVGTVDQILPKFCVVRFDLDELVGLGEEEEEERSAEEEGGDDVGTFRAYVGRDRVTKIQV
mmetsp:Transcript_33765/g.74072  ORF Transcript_33765/g.74072 Transcript_33765/m.74072 type:complete len:611 (+) Transcript_33765:127-1959(+)